MFEISANDWQALQSLCNRAGMPDERVGALRRRLDETAPARPGCPYVLIVGCPDAGLELLLARWIAPEAAERAIQADGRPVVIGRTPTEVRPKLGTWQTWNWPSYDGGHLIALRSTGNLRSDTLAQLASLGFVDQLVLVTKLGQPFTSKERELVRSLASTAATARVLIVGLPGEEPTDANLAEVLALGSKILRQAGFDNERSLGVRVWFTDGKQRGSTITDLKQSLAVEPAAVSAGRSGMARVALAGLFTDLQRFAEKAPANAQATVTDEEREQLLRQLSSYLSDLGRVLNRKIEKRPALTVTDLRTYAIDSLRGWGAYTSLEGHWMKLVDRLRPGAHVALLAEAESALQVLHYETGPQPSPEVAKQPDPGLVDRVLVEAQRLALGLVFGAAAYWASIHFLSGGHASVATIIGCAALVLGTVLGYGVARRFIKLAAVNRPVGATPAPPALDGWSQVEMRLMAWFNDWFVARTPSPTKECRVLADRFGVKDL